MASRIVRRSAVLACAGRESEAFMLGDSLDGQTSADTRSLRAGDEQLWRQGQRRASLNHLIRSQQHRRRNGEAEGLRGMEIDNELEFRRLLDWHVTRLGALE